MSLTFFGLLFFAIGLLLLYVAIRARRRAKAAMAWPSVPGRIVESRVESYQTTNDQEKWVTAYRPRIAYQYAVNGAPYQSHKIDVGGVARKAEQVVAAYPVGREVPVYVNPANPAEAALERSTAKGYVVMMVMSVPFMGLGLVVAAAGVAAHFFHGSM
jgi:Protein of unknown function (DUF3592)